MHRSPSTPERHRVAVVGGGPAGCATALALARLGIDGVVLLEAGDPASCGAGAPKVGESLPPDSRRLLLRLGVLDDFLAAGHQRCPGNASAWGDDRLGHDDFLFNPHGHGWHLDRRRFDAFLLAAVVDAGVEVRTGTRVAGARPAGDRRTALALCDGGGAEVVAEADLVVDATGYRALVARALGAEKRHLDHLICANGFFRLPPGAAAGFPQHTLLEAVEYGWWYAARLPRGRVAVAVASDPAILKRRGLAGEAAWLAALAGTRHVGPALAGAGYEPRSLRAWPAHSFRLDPAASGRSAGGGAVPGAGGWLAVGDAAAAYDPLSAQGIHKALGDGLDAAEAIHRALAGDATAFAAYASRRAAAFHAYRRQRRHLYGLERRWAECQFWRRRAGATGVAAEAVAEPAPGSASGAGAPGAHRTAVSV